MFSSAIEHFSLLFILDFFSDPDDLIADIQSGVEQAQSLRFYIYQYFFRVKRNAQMKISNLQKIVI